MLGIEGEQTVKVEMTIKKKGKIALKDIVWIRC